MIRAIEVRSRSIRSYRFFLISVSGRSGHASPLWVIRGRRANSDWLHSLLFDDTERRRSFQEIEQIQGSIAEFRVRADCATERCIKLNLGRQRSRKLNTRSGKCLSDRDDGQFDLTLGHEFGRQICFRNCGLGGQRFLKSKSIDYLRYAGHRKVGDRFCVQERPLEVFQRANVWLGRPLANRDAVC